MIDKLSSILTKNDKKLFLWMIAFSLIISVIETVGISLIMPFISIATNFSLIESNQYYKFLYEFGEFSKPHYFVIALGGMLVLFYIIRSAINIYYYYILNDFTNSRYYLLVSRLFKHYLNMRYRDFVKHNSSVLTKTIVTEADNLSKIIYNYLMLISELFVVILIYGLMLYVNYSVTLFLTLFLILNGILLSKLVTKKMKEIGSNRAKIQKSFFEIINKTLGNYKFIKLKSVDDVIVDEFNVISKDFADATTKAQTLQQFPRFFLEAIGFSLIALIITYLVWEYENNISSVLSTISMFVLALYRLMPSVNRIMGAYNTIMFNHKALEIIHTDLMYETEQLEEKELSFHKDIKLSNINFEYEKNKKILNDVNLTIEKGSRIAFIGESGGGKSTLVDLIMGLHQPISGNIEVDGVKIDSSNVKELRRKIGYIPQHIYLFDGTVKENVVFGNEYDEERLIKILKTVNIYDVLLSKEGIETRVGEGGIMLSGGQKQRLAIARAIYHEPEILVLDEATSALDHEMEENIMNEIYKISKSKTLIIIAHRLSTIKQCEFIYKLENGKLKEID